MVTIRHSLLDLNVYLDEEGGSIMTPTLRGKTLSQSFVLKHLYFFVRPIAKIASSQYQSFTTPTTLLVLIAGMPNTLIDWSNSHIIS